MGTVHVSIPELEVTQNVRDRYASYIPPAAETLTGEAVTQFIQDKTQTAKTSKLVEMPQLEALAEILKWPTDWTAPEGMY
jgi:hypothetical protein